MHAFGADYWLIKDQRSIPHNAINKNVGFFFFFSHETLPHEEQSMCGRCNYLAELGPRRAPTADHKMSSYSVSSTDRCTRRPGRLRITVAIWLVSKPAHRKKGSDVSHSAGQAKNKDAFCN